MANDCYARLTDSQLAEQVRAGAPDAFGELCSRYLWLIQAKASQFSGPAAPEKEDLLQEGFLGLYAAAGSFRQAGGASFSTYAGVCIYNRMASATRRHSNLGNRMLNESLSLDSAQDLPLAGGEPQEQIELRESFQAMWRRLDSALSPLERRALALYLAGLRREDVEARAGMRLKVFDNALHRVRAKLRGAKNEIEVDDECTQI